jgi:hypothetical protein
MSGNVLTRYESACRGGHEQAQLLLHLYQHLVDDAEDALTEQLNVQSRSKQLRRDRDLLAKKLSQLDLLQTEPDPEREQLLELFTDLKRAFTTDDEQAISERLASEESEFLKLVEEVAEHDNDESVASSVGQTREAIALLASLSGSGH